MKKNIITLIFIAISMITIIYLTRINYKQAYFIDYEKIVLKNTSDSINILQENIISHLKAENASLTDSIIKDEDDNEVLKSNLNNFCPVLILRFSELDCSTCIQDQLTLLNDLLQSNGINYLIISDYKGIRNFGIFKRTNKIKVPIYNCKKLLTSETSTPYYFILNKNGVISDFFYPYKTFPRLTSVYLKLIRDKYFRKGDIPTNF